MKRLFSTKGILALLVLTAGAVWSLQQVDTPTRSPDPTVAVTPKNQASKKPKTNKRGPQARPKTIPNKRFIEIKATEFLMGAQSTDPDAAGYDPNAAQDEGPPRRVTVDAFAIQKFEVEAYRYQECVQASACDPIPPTSPMLTIGTEVRLRLPVNFVTWNNAVQYCNYIDARLPTEAEWELAARGADGRKYPFGDEPRCPTNTFLQDSSPNDGKSGKQEERDPTANEPSAIDKGCSLESPPNPSDSVKAHPLGIVQLAGSMWEWVSDHYADSYDKAGGNTNPKGPETGTRRVQRGGGWMSSSTLDFRGAARASLNPQARMPDVGFRCARSL